jgi:hypothetical protein
MRRSGSDTVEGRGRPRSGGPSGRRGRPLALAAGLLLALALGAAAAAPGGPPEAALRGDDGSAGYLAYLAAADAAAARAPAELPGDQQAAAAGVVPARSPAAAGGGPPPAALAAGALGLTGLTGGLRLAGRRRPQRSGGEARPGTTPAAPRRLPHSPVACRPVPVESRGLPQTPGAIGAPTRVLRRGRRPPRPRPARLGRTSPAAGRRSVARGG